MFGTAKLSFSSRLNINQINQPLTAKILKLLKGFVEMADALQEIRLLLLKLDFITHEFKRPLSS